MLDEILLNEQQQQTRKCDSFLPNRNTIIDCVCSNEKNHCG